MLERIEDLILSLKGYFLYLFFLKKSCYWSEKKIRQYQYKKLKQLLLICQTNIPYYKRLFKEIEFDTEKDFKTLDDIKKIPITTKNNVRTHNNEFINPDYIGKSLQCKTSGSTGEPLMVFVSKKQWVMEQGTVWRHWAWSGYHFRDKMGIVRSYAPKNGKLIKVDRLRNFIYYSPYDLTDQNMAMYLDHMTKENVKFLRGYPSSLETLALFVLKTNHRTPKIKGIFSASEVLTDTARATIEEAFGVKVTNWYGLAECIVTMGDCNKHNGLHIFEEYGYTEFLDTDIPNQKKIIGTNLHNYAMPLLRYETNDIADIGERCKCRHRLRTIKNITGRSNSVIKFKDRDVPLTNFYTLMEHYPQVVSWQIVQRGQLEIELIVGRKLDKATKKELIEEYVARIPNDVKFYISEEKEFVKKNEGKKVAFVRTYA